MSSFTTGWHALAVYPPYAQHCSSVRTTIDFGVFFISAPHPLRYIRRFIVVKTYFLFLRYAVFVFLAIRPLLSLAAHSKRPAGTAGGILDQPPSQSTGLPDQHDPQCSAATPLFLVRRPVTSREGQEKGEAQRNRYVPHTLPRGDYEYSY